MELERFSLEGDEYYYGCHDEFGHDYTISNMGGPNGWKLAKVSYCDDDLYQSVIIHGYGDESEYHTLKVEVHGVLRTLRLGPKSIVLQDTITDFESKDREKIVYFSDGCTDTGHPLTLEEYLKTKKSFVNMLGTKYQGHCASDKYFLFFLAKSAELIPAIMAAEEEFKKKGL